MPEVMYDVRNMDVWAHIMNQHMRYKWEIKPIKKGESRKVDQ